MTIKSTIRMTQGIQKSQDCEGLPNIKACYKNGEPEEEGDIVVADELLEVIIVGGLSEVTEELISMRLTLPNPGVHNNTLDLTDILIKNYYYYDFISEHLTKDGVYLLDLLMDI